MLVPNKNVTNTIEIDTEEFLIITGSNMAGKSTFLRSVGFVHCNGKLGLPVNASDCEYGPIKLISSMRSIDSLQKGDSYFLSELKRLKVIVESIEKDSYFVLLDEILRGTNSVDKANGSKRFLARLINERATGLIATHDLSLCDMADSTKGIYNYHFDAAIVDDELHFDYKLHRGISKTMNATFLLEKMDLV